MKRMTRLWILLPCFVLAGGCNLLPNAYSGCAEPKPYQSAEEAPPLRVPNGAVVPDTRNAMRVPAVTAPQLPREERRCLDHPPSYGTERPPVD